MDHKGVWIIAEQVDGRVRIVSHELLGRGRELADKLGCELTAVIFGNEINKDDLQELIHRGADKVIATENPELAHFDCQRYSACLEQLIDQNKPEIIIAGATSSGRTLMPYVAIKAHAGLTADCTVLDIEEDTGNLLQTRPAIGGNILATIKTPSHRPQMATVRPHSSKPAEADESRTGEIICRAAAAELLSSDVERLDFVPDTAKHGLDDAERVVAVGRGIKKAENLPIIEQLADKLGAAVGATRDVVDRGWLSYPHQVGLSGKTVTPNLYIAIGASGAVQHLAGMQTAETIVAINTDPEAPIFNVADFGIIGDLFEIVPALTEKIKKD